MSVYNACKQCILSLKYSRREGIGVLEMTILFEKIKYYFGLNSSLNNELDTDGRQFVS